MKVVIIYILKSTGLSVYAPDLSSQRQEAPNVHQLLKAKLLGEAVTLMPLPLCWKRERMADICVWTTSSRTARTPRTHFPWSALNGPWHSSRSRWFSALDVAAGYNQAQFTEKDKLKRAFWLPLGCLQTWMPCGLCDAANIILKLITKIFEDQFYESLLLCLDDVVLSPSVAEYVGCMLCWAAYSTSVSEQIEKELLLLPRGELL